MCGAAIGGAATCGLVVNHAGIHRLGKSGWYAGARRALGQKDGTIRADIDSRCLIGNCMVYYSNRFTLSRALEVDLASSKVLRQTEKAGAALILNEIKA